MSRQGQPFTEAERLDWLRLIRSEHVGPVTFYQLLARFGSAAAALEALPALARRGGRQRPIRIASRDAAQRELDAIATLGGQALCRDEPGYPPSLAAVEDAPPVLYLRGRTDLLGRRAIGVVGARNASANGRRFAETLAAELARAGIVVVSGFARGIDAAAHRGALGASAPGNNGGNGGGAGAAEAGSTIAAVAGGIDVVYPEENRALHDAIVTDGLVVAEMPPGTVPQGRHFPRRNRIISGLASGVVVVEAAERSGSLITARFALEQGREVFAVPGSPLDPRARGANRLIRDGATLIESAADVIAALAGGIRPKSLPERHDPAPEPVPGRAGEAALAAARLVVLECLGPEPAPVDEVLRQCHLSPAVVAMVLLEFELAGRLERHPGHRVSLLS